MRYDVLVVDDDDATRVGLAALLTNAGFVVDAAGDGRTALEKLERHDIGVALLDVRLPDIDGLGILEQCVARKRPAKAIVMTGIDTTDAALNALRRQAYDFLPKPIEPSRLVDMVRRALTTAPDPIEVLSAKPEWVELVVPCTREAVERIQSFVQQLEADLPQEVRDSVGLAFRELLMNGVEWGGQLDPTQRLRVSYVRTRRMLLYRIADPGRGFAFDGLSHAAIANPEGGMAHAEIREARGIRPGGFGLMLIRAIADELVYNERQNEVLFVKYLDEAATTS